jgi:hypothetical protein
MSAIDRIAFSMNRRDEVPNQELARTLAENRDRQGIREIAENLRHENPDIQSDCLKVLYEIGYLTPELVAEYVEAFLGLLKHKNNRMVWGGLIALATIVRLKAPEIYAQAAEITRLMESGSAISVDNAVRILAGLCQANGDYERILFPHLVEHLRGCRLQDVARHAEYSLAAVRPHNRAEMNAVLELRLPELSPAQAARVQKLLRSIAKGPA